jgi:hypothetical protein
MLVLKFKQFYKLEVHLFGVILGDGHGREVAFLVGGVELNDLDFHFVLVDLPSVVNIHLRPLNPILYMSSHLNYFPSCHSYPHPLSSPRPCITVREQLFSTEVSGDGRRLVVYIY